MAAKLPPKCIIPTVTLGCLPYLDAESRVEDVDAMVQFLTARVFCGATSPLLGPQQKPRIRPRLGLPIPFKHLDLHCHFLCLILAPGPLTLLTTLLPRPGFHFDTHTREPPNSSSCVHAIRLPNDVRFVWQSAQNML